MYPIILIRILRRNPEQLKTTNQDEATPPEDLKEVKEAPKEPIEAFEAIKKKNNQIVERKEGTPRCRKEIEADGISAHGNQQDGCTSSILVNK